jgi:hypothetical protein
MKDEEKRNIKNHHPDAEKKTSYGGWTSPKTRHGGWSGDLEVSWGLLLGIYQIGIPAT